MASACEIFERQYGEEQTRARYARIEEWLLGLAVNLNLQPNDWRCLMDCLNGNMFEHEITLQPGAIEGEIVDVARLEPERFNRWGVGVSALTAKIQPLTDLQRLALCYRVRWLFDLPDDEQARHVWPEGEGADAGDRG